MICIRSPTARLILLERLQGRLQLRGGDGHAVVLDGGRVEGPDLHGRDALLQQAFGDGVGLGHEAVQVFIGAGRRIEVPGRDGLDVVRPHIAVARAGVVDALLRAAQPAQHLVHRLLAHLAEQVPQRDVDGGCRAVLHARAGLRHGQVQHLAMQRLDVQRVPAQQAPGEGIVQVRLDCARAIESLAQADHPGVRMHAHPDDVGELAGPQCLDGRDLHAALPGHGLAVAHDADGGRADSLARFAAHGIPPPGREMSSRLHCVPRAPATMLWHARSPSRDGQRL